MQYEYNNGSLEDHAVQNRFTAYLKVSVNHYKARYVRRLRQQQQQELYMEDPDTLSADMNLSLPGTQLHAALAQLRGHAQTILLEHILGDKSLVQLARELDMPYPTVKAIYRRALEKLRKELQDEFH